MIDPRALPKVIDVRDDLTKHPSKHYGQRRLDQITHLAVHHSLTSSGSAESFARYHVQNNGWPGIGYHFVIEKNGQIKWCNEVEKRSYHVGNSNTKSVGICMVGDFRNSEPTDAQRASLHKLLRWLMQELNIPVENVQGHSEFPDYEWKACPCIDMNELRTGLQKLNTRAEKEYYGPRNNLPTDNGMSLAWILNKMNERGHVVFKKDHIPYNLNLVGVRSSSREANAFDDHVCCFYKYQGKWVFRAYTATTDPGLYWLNHPTNSHGTAILKAGQYRGAYSLGLHRGRYEALRQVGPVTVIRDVDRDGRLDIKGGIEQTGIFGINIHRAVSGGESPLVNKWSAGCQVLANSNDFTELIALCKKATTYWGGSFSYTLLDV